MTASKGIFHHSPLQTDCGIHPPSHGNPLTPRPWQRKIHCTARVATRTEQRLASSQQLPTDQFGAGPG